MASRGSSSDSRWWPRRKSLAKFGQAFDGHIGFHGTKNDLFYTAVIPPSAVIELDHSVGFVARCLLRGFPDPTVINRRYGPGGGPRISTSYFADNAASFSANFSMSGTLGGGSVGDGAGSPTSSKNSSKPAG